MDRLCSQGEDVPSVEGSGREREPPDPASWEDGIFTLPWALVGQLWPADRVVLGRRVCRLLRHELLRHVPEVVLVPSACGSVSECQLIEDLVRVQESQVLLR